jgi:hypothetical protein
MNRKLWMVSYGETALKRGRKISVKKGKNL